MRKVDVIIKNTAQLIATQNFETILNILSLSRGFTELRFKQVRTNIGLADTLLPSSLIYFIYMGGIGPCDSIKIIFDYNVNSSHIILNIKYYVNRMFHVVKTPVYRFDLYGRYRSMWTDDDHYW